VFQLVLQGRRTLDIDNGMSVETEASLLRAAKQAGAPVATLLAVDPSGTQLGLPYLLLERLDGETVPQRILREEQYASARKMLARQYGEALAVMQRVPLDQVPGVPPQDPLSYYREILDEVGSPHPALELGFRWLEAHLPPTAPEVLVHGDFRNGNGIVTSDGLAAVIDFELAHRGNPLEDMGWFCIRAWRFGHVGHAGGFGSVADLVEGYQSAGGGPVDPQSLHWWQVLGTVRWSVICLMQGATQLSGHRRSIELAAVGRRACEPEFDLMLLLP
jgi:aminoglycoside phosphotransferase (APT) family kinase protein